MTVNHLPEPDETTTKKYYSIAGQMVAMDDRTNLRYFASDHLSSTSIVMNNTGGLLYHNRYMPFGEVRDDISGGPIPETITDFTYTGQRNLATMGLMDYKARFYSPTLGRFTQPDTIVPQPGNPQAWNRYTYVLNNPLIYVDPTGHFGLLATLGIAAVVGAAVGAAGSYVVQVVSNVVEDGFSADDLTNVDGKEIIAGAVSGAVGATVGVVGAALGAVGVAGVVVTGAIGGAASGQASKAAMNVMDGRKWSEGLGKARDLIRDGVIGGVTAGIGYGIGKYVKAKFQRFKGGPYDALETSLDDGTAVHRHHLIQDDLSPFGDGTPSIQMDPTDHRITASYGSGGHDGTPFKETTRELIDNEQYWKALEQGIRDVVKKNKLKYDWAILDAIGYTIKSKLFN